MIEVVVNETTTGGVHESGLNTIQNNIQTYERAAKRSFMWLCRLHSCRNRCSISFEWTSMWNEMLWFVVWIERRQMKMIMACKIPLHKELSSYGCSRVRRRPFSPHADELSKWSNYLVISHTLYRPRSFAFHASENFTQ